MSKKLRINWTTEMEAGMLQGLVQAIHQGLRADSSYKKEGWQMALDGACLHTRYPITIKQIKSKHDVHKRDWKVWKELCSQSGWGWDEDKGTPIASEEVMDTYFTAHPDAAKFRDTPLPFLEELTELFEGVVATGNYAVTPDESFNQYNRTQTIDPELLREESVATTLNSRSEEEEIDDEDEPHFSAGSDNSGRSTTTSSRQSSMSASPGPSSRYYRTPARSTSSLNIRKRAAEQAAQLGEEDAKRQRLKKKGTADKLSDSVSLVSEEIRATRELLGQMSPLEKASEEFMKEYSEMDIDDQVLILQAFSEDPSIARMYLITSGEIRKRLINKILLKKKQEEESITGGGSN
jgi:hypothetical protein